MAINVSHCSAPWRFSIAFRILSISSCSERLSPSCSSLSVAQLPHSVGSCSRCIATSSVLASLSRTGSWSCVTPSSSASAARAGVFSRRCQMPFEGEQTDARNESKWGLMQESYFDCFGGVEISGHALPFVRLRANPLLALARRLVRDLQVCFAQHTCQRRSG